MENLADHTQELMQMDPTVELFVQRVRTVDRFAWMGVLEGRDIAQRKHIIFQVIESDPNKDYSGYSDDELAKIDVEPDYRRMALALAPLARISFHTLIPPKDSNLSPETLAEFVKMRYEQDTVSPYKLTSAFRF